MADESFELEDAEVLASPVTNGPSSAAAAAAAADDVRLRAQLREAAAVLRQRGQADLARLALGLVDADHRDAIWVLDNQVPGGAVFDEFRSVLRRFVQEVDEDELSEAFPDMVVMAAQHAAHLDQIYYGIVDDDETSRQPQPYRDGGFGAVPASAAAVRTLEKQTFVRAAGENADGITECGICFEEFVDGVEVTVMPCPSRVHKFHPDCISKWLAISKTCPLCRYELPAYYE